VDDAGASHRLDHGQDGLAVGFLDSPCERPQGVDVGRDRELVDVLTLLREQADVELAPTQV
jgi:hypothetical protein